MNSSPTTRRGFIRLLAAIAAVSGYQSESYVKAFKTGYRHGKHNGQTQGAFGGRNTAKNHRRLYVSQ